MAEVIGRAKGGVARAKKLSPETRSDIARKAAQGRWSADAPPKAEHTGDLHIGELVIPCAVLPDGTRVLSQRGVGRALGRSFGGQSWKRSDDGSAGGLPFYLNVGILKPFIPSDLMELLAKPALYRHGKGGGVAMGLVATALPQVCNVWLKAREEGKLNDAQLAVAQRAEIIMRGLAEVGIVALVDEATGYQDVRDRAALQEILNAYLRKELAAWAKRFPDEFYQQIFRLRNWTKKNDNPTSRPQIVAFYTKDIVYARLAPGIIDELEKRNPIERGNRKARHHQWLTEDVGHPALAQHLYAVITLMRVSQNWDQFKQLLDQAHPVRKDTAQMPLMLEPPISQPLATPTLSIESLPLFARPIDTPKT
ncbi:P63C domain-containing protein [Inquilinus sp. Marseille-Q2685]|uniref:P63C domain-containing protein n=1 Tax=Inquilinus sp. Marseille-Q2685 TaxID=2866581 RepID=UPI001CE3D306|nr:P63C domain-containing protein [Inquilinus sp. Marseille-Q2685]